MTIKTLLIKWYSQHGRLLPWRYNISSYNVWLAEIIMQQTRIIQGLKYYKKFTESYLTVDELAKAELDEVLKLWQGLGYYTRARNLHVTAKIISEQYNGVFPSTFNELRKLKGVGDYTAAAIASLVNKEPVAVVDGNVLRVLSRLFGIYTPIDTSAAKKEFSALANDLLDKDQPDIYNQAIMDFGAMVCTPKQALCSTCPFAERCYACLNDCVDTLPAKSKKIKVRDRFFNYLIVTCEKDTFIRQRTQKDIWHMLYEFPLIECDGKTGIDELMKTNEWKELFGFANVEIKSFSQSIKHQLSHQTIYCVFYHVSVINTGNRLAGDYLRIPINIFEQYSIPRLIDSYLIATKPGVFFAE